MKVVKPLCICRDNPNNTVGLGIRRGCWEGGVGGGCCRGVGEVAFCLLCCLLVFKAQLVENLLNITKQQVINIDDQ